MKKIIAMLLTGMMLFSCAFAIEIDLSSIRVKTYGIEAWDHFNQTIEFITVEDTGYTKPTTDYSLILTGVDYIDEAPVKYIATGLENADDFLHGYSPYRTLYDEDGNAMPDLYLDGYTSINQDYVTKNNWEILDIFHLLGSSKLASSLDTDGQGLTVTLYEKTVTKDTGIDFITVLSRDSKHWYLFPSTKVSMTDEGYVKLSLESLAYLAFLRPIGESDEPYSPSPAKTAQTYANAAVDANGDALTVLNMAANQLSYPEGSYVAVTNAENRDYAPTATITSQLADAYDQIKFLASAADLTSDQGKSIERELNASLQEQGITAFAAEDMTVLDVVSITGNAKSASGTTVTLTESGVTGNEQNVTLLFSQNGTNWSVFPYENVKLGSDGKLDVTLNEFGYFCILVPKAD